MSISIHRVLMHGKSSLKFGHTNNKLTFNYILSNWYKCAIGAFFFRKRSGFIHLTHNTFFKLLASSWTSGTLLTISNKNVKKNIFQTFNQTLLLIHV